MALFDLGKKKEAREFPDFKFPEEPKLPPLQSAKPFPKFPEFEVLHLDHERGYFSQERWIKNRETQNRRRSQGVLKSIEEDLDESS